MRIFRRKDGRMYVLAEPSVDLFGAEIVLTYHCGRGRGGGTKTYVASPRRSSQAIIKSIVQTRLRHGYIEVLSNTHDRQ